MSSRVWVWSALVFVPLVGAAIGTAAAVGHWHTRTEAIAIEQPSEESTICDRTVSIPVTVGYDDAWVAIYGEDASRQAERIVASSSAVYLPTCFQFRTVQSLVWNTAVSPASMPDLFGMVAQGLNHRRGQFLVYLTGLSLTGAVDGLAGSKVALVRYHPGDPQMDVVVAAHELGHLLGFHNNDPPCGCLMDPSATTTVMDPEHAAVLVATSKAKGDPLDALLFLSHTSPGD